MLMTSRHFVELGCWNTLLTLTMANVRGYNARDQAGERILILRVTRV